jgi:kynurenine formamidase
MHAIDDAPFDPDAVEAGCWAPGPYGPGDTLGSYREVTPTKRAEALALLDRERPLRTFHLGATLTPSYPAFGDRSFASRLHVSGFETDGASVSRRRPLGANRLTSVEERVAFTFNMGAKINGLHHCGVGRTGYGGRDLAALVEAGGGALDTTTWGPPLVTRGLLVDVLALKVCERADHALSAAPDGRPLLRDNYRVTVEDLQAAARRQHLPPFGPGDVVLLHTGWQRLVEDDPERYLRANPGPWLREVRWLAQFRPAIVGADTWCFETLDPETNGGLVNPCHQELLVRFGIRIAEGMFLDELVEAEVDRFVFCHTPLRAEGAVSSNAPAIALAN